MSCSSFSHVDLQNLHTKSREKWFDSSDEESPDVIESDKYSRSLTFSPSEQDQSHFQSSTVESSTKASSKKGFNPGLIFQPI